MRSQEALNYDQYKLQKLNSEFADSVVVSSSKATNEETIRSLLPGLAERLGEFISKQGYRPSDKSELIIKIPGVTADPTNPFSTMGGKSECTLTATKDQYVLYASEVIDELKAECKRQIEKTWKDRLDELLTSAFYEKYPWLEFDYDEEGHQERFEDQKDQFLAKVAELVESFEIPTLE